jgi:hypothetical protein
MSKTLGPCLRRPIGERHRAGCDVERCPRGTPDFISRSYGRRSYDHPIALLENAVQSDENFLANFLELDEAEIARLAHGRDVRAINDLVLERHKNRMQALAAALESEDDLGKVVRGHIHIEHELQQIIFFAAPNPDELKRFER